MWGCLPQPLMGLPRMNREDFKSYLVRCVQDNLLTESEAKDLLRQFDNNELDTSDMPLPLPEAIDRPTRRDAELAILALITLGMLAKQGLAGLSERRKHEIREKLQDRFQSEARRLTESLYAGEKLGVWQRSFSDLIRDNILQQAQIGAGRSLTTEGLKALTPTIQKQQAFASRFADEVKARALIGQPMTVGEAANRAELYAGAGRVEWYRGFVFSGDDGTVVDYISLDSSTTCEPCLAADASGPYLPDDPNMPLPGAVCLGGGRCRCELRERFAPDEARRVAA